MAERLRNNRSAQSRCLARCKQDCGCIWALCSPPLMSQICENSSWLRGREREREKSARFTHHRAFGLYLRISTPRITRTFTDEELGHVEGGFDSWRGVWDVRPAPFKGVFLWVPLRPINWIIICWEERRWNTLLENIYTHKLTLITSLIPSTVDTNSICPSVFVERTL